MLWSWGRINWKPTLGRNLLFGWGLIFMLASWSPNAQETGTIMSLQNFVLSHDTKISVCFTGGVMRTFTICLIVALISSNMGVRDACGSFNERSVFLYHIVFLVAWKGERISLSFVLVPGSGCLTHCQTNTTSPYILFVRVVDLQDTTSLLHKPESTHASRPEYVE